MCTFILEPTALCALLILTFITLSFVFLPQPSNLLSSHLSPSSSSSLISPFHIISHLPFLTSYPISPFSPYLPSLLALPSSLPLTEPMFRFKFADAGNMSPPLISFSEVAFSYSGANTHIHTHTHTPQDQSSALHSTYSSIHPSIHLNLDDHKQLKYSLLSPLAYMNTQERRRIISSRTYLSASIQPAESC